jgi:O-antigen ligase
MNRPLQREDLRWFYFLTGLFAVVAAVGFVKGIPLVAGLPVFFLLLLLTIFRLDAVIFLAVLVTPLSVNLAQTGIGIGVSLPSEPLMFSLFLVYCLKIISERGIASEVLTHPVTLVILLHMAWYAVTTITSTMPLVSVKSTLARYCYIVVFYFMLIELFRKYNNLLRFQWMYLIALVAVIFYTITIHAAGGFSEEAAHVAMTPFYNDHTAYAAVLSFFIPILFSFATDKKQTLLYRNFSLLILMLLITAVILSYTRAAWVGLIGAFGCWLIFVMRLKSALIYGAAAMILVVLFMFRSQITMQLEQNNKVSSTDYASHVQSIGNISTDDSNVERLNRWASALRMFADKPFFGFGPGTYMFQYAPYQKYSERSGISTNFGTGGGSHSEYLGPLSEQGFMAPLIFILLIIVVTHAASRIIRTSDDPSVKGLTKGLLLGLVTYWIHGVLNYFLDTEKASVPFWGFIASIVAIDLYHRSRKLMPGDDSSRA